MTIAIIVTEVTIVPLFTTCVCNFKRSFYEPSKMPVVVKKKKTSPTP